MKRKYTRRKFTWKSVPSKRDGFDAYDLFVNGRDFGILYYSTKLEINSRFEVHAQSGGGVYCQHIAFFKTTKDIKILYKDVIKYLKENYSHYFYK